MLDVLVSPLFQMSERSHKIRVLCLSIWYPFSISRYFEKALRHREDIDLITTGVYTGSWIPWLGGMSLPDKYALPPDIPLPFRPDIGQINYELVRALLPKEWIPDIILSIDAGVCWKTKPSEGMVVHVATDPHVLNYDHQRSISDKFFNMQKIYSQKGDIWLPYAYSSYDFFPEDEYLAGSSDERGYKDTDAVLIGMPYENRVQWVNRLMERGVSVIFENGPIFDEARNLYNRGRIGLNWSSMQDLNCRAFELAAMKLTPVMNYVPDMNEFFVPSFDFLGFDNLDEAVEQVIWAKDNPNEAKQIAESAYRVVQGQTYDARVEQILRDIDYV